MLWALIVRLLQMISRKAGSGKVLEIALSKTAFEERAKLHRPVRALVAMSFWVQ